MTDRLDRAMEELRQTINGDPQLTARFLAHAVWADLLPIPDSALAHRTLWQDRGKVALELGVGVVGPSAFIRHVYADLLKRVGGLGEDDIALRDSGLIETYRTAVRRNAANKIPNLLKERVPPWQRRLMALGPTSTRKEVNALAFALRRAHRL